MFQNLYWFLFYAKQGSDALQFLTGPLPKVGDDRQD